MIQKLKAQVNIILEEEGAEEKNNKAEEELLKLITPNHWNLNIDDNAEKSLELGFEEFMLSVKENTTEDLENITTFRFYSLLDFIKKKQNGR